MAQHLALYRKWRPLTFDHVFGQDAITNALRNQVQQDRVSHAYLFTGTRGTGKTTCAKILARAVCCEHPVNGSPCNQCAACRAILDESALDVTEIDAASNNGVDNIREIREESTFAPTAMKRRVYIIDEVHMLSAGAFNALLKTLEEPPAHVLFILATTEIHKVPATILSRCQRYDFRRIPPEVIAARLSQIAADEGFTLEPRAASLLARLGDGSMRDAISLLDRSVPADGHIDEAQVTEALGVAGSDTVIAIFRALQAGDAAQALELFTHCYLEGRDIVSLFDQLLSLMRDLYVLKTTGRNEYLTFSAPVSAMQTLAKDCDNATLEYFVACVSDLLTRLTRTAIKRTDGEMCLLKMAVRHTRGAQVQPAPPAPVAAPIPAAAPVSAAPAAAPVAAKPAVDPKDAPFDVDEPVKPAAAPAAPAAPVREAPKAAAPAKPEPAPAPAAAAGGDVKAPFLALASSQVNSAVRTYLGLAEMEARNGTLHIYVRDEAMIFMKKPAVQELLLSCAKQVGHQAIAIEKLSDKPKAAPAPGPGISGGLADILSSARSLGVEVKTK